MIVEKSLAKLVQSALFLNDQHILALCLNLPHSPEAIDASYHLLSANHLISIQLNHHIPNHQTSTRAHYHQFFPRDIEVECEYFDV